MSRRSTPVWMLAAWIMSASPAHAQTMALPQGDYKLDPRHTSITFRISHLGISYFAGRFDRAVGSLTYDPQNPAHNALDVTIDIKGIDTNDEELDQDLQGENWFDAQHYPQASFRAASMEILDDHRARITGDFTLHGETHRLVLDAVLIGSGTMPLSSTPIVGFSAKTSFDRSAYGINNLQPMVGDEVQLQIDCEFDREKK